MYKRQKFNFSGWKESVISIVFIVLSFVIGANLPIILGKAAWSYITFVYIFFAAVLPKMCIRDSATSESSPRTSSTLEVIRSGWVDRRSR